MKAAPSRITQSRRVGSKYKRGGARRRGMARTIGSGATDVKSNAIRELRTDAAATNYVLEKILDQSTINLKRNQDGTSLRKDVARLRGLPAPEGERVIDPPTSDIVPPGEQGRLYVGPPPLGPDDPKPRSTAAIDGKAVPTGTTDAEREANRQRVNNDRSAYTQQGLRPAGGEPWRGHAGGVDESFFWGGSTGKRAW